MEQQGPQSAETKLLLAWARWGHPMHWPVPCPQPPRWWRWQQRRHEDELRLIFGTLNQTQRDIFWVETRKGQSVYEDAGGYLARPYQAMLGLRVEEPYTYNQAIIDLMKKDPS